MARTSLHVTAGAALDNSFPHNLSSERARLTASRNSPRIESIPGTPVPVPVSPGGEVGGETVPESPPPHPVRNDRKTANKKVATGFLPVVAAGTGGLFRSSMKSISEQLLPDLKRDGSAFRTRAHKTRNSRIPLPTRDQPTRSPSDKERKDERGLLIRVLGQFINSPMVS
jgi:hypothetical protein